MEQGFTSEMRDRARSAPITGIPYGCGGGWVSPCNNWSTCLLSSHSGRTPLGPHGGQCISSLVDWHRHLSRKRSIRWAWKQGRLLHSRQQVQRRLCDPIMSWWGGVWAPLSVSMWLCWWRCCCLVAKSNPTLLGAHGCSLPVSSVHGISQARILEWRTSSSSRGPSHSGIEPACPVSLQWQVDSLPRADVGSPLRGLKVKWSSSVVSDSLWPRGL